MTPKPNRGKTEDSRTLTIRLDSKTYDELTKRAEADDRTLSSYCGRVLKLHLKEKAQ